MTEQRPSSVRWHRVAVLAGSCHVLGCLQLTGVQGSLCGTHPDSCLVPATWPRLVRRLLLHWGPAHERPSFSKVAKYVQVRCQERSVSMISPVLPLPGWTADLGEQTAHPMAAL